MGQVNIPMAWVAMQKLLSALCSWRQCGDEVSCKLLAVTP